MGTAKPGRRNRSRDLGLPLPAGHQIDDDFMAHQRLATPVLSDEGEQPMFDLVPLAGVRVIREAHAIPPPANACDGKSRRVMIHSYIDPTYIASQIIDSVGSHLAQFRNPEIVHSNFLRLALGLQFAPPILEVDDLFLIFS